MKWTWPKVFMRLDCLIIGHSKIPIRKGDVMTSESFVPLNLGNEFRKKSRALWERAGFLQKLSQALDSLAVIMDTMQLQNPGQTTSVPDLLDSLVTIANVMKLGGVEDKGLLDLIEKVGKI